MQVLKVPKQEVEKPKLNIKRAEGAREVARKLLKSGAVAIQKPVKQEISFKRPKNQERKKASSDVNPVTTYQPFSASTSDSDLQTRASKDPVSEKMETSEGGTPRQNLYQHFAQERDKEERGVSDKADAKDKRTGNTIYVSGNKISEDYLRKHFTEFGQILNISMETEKYRGFITFNKPEAAEKAITEVRENISNQNEVSWSEFNS